MLPSSVITSLKKVDPDRFRAALFAQSDQRERLNLLYAFHYELALIGDARRGGDTPFLGG